jgi:hypothetical protein
MDKELIPWLLLASMAGRLGALWLAKAWQRLRNGPPRRNAYGPPERRR